MSKKKFKTSALASFSNDLEKRVDEHAEMKNEISKLNKITKEKHEPQIQELILRIE